ncbi:MAG: ABC transporter transmembrane domain-containing protein, partial [Anaerolineales bacterium]|nr:ABC transporter transmembrane domain-containing protein [Anaerolineales bacterium]
MMHGRAGGFLNQETMKPRNLSETLGRLGKYFGRFWYMIVLAVFFVVVSTWTQVTSPELMGQATDCFLVPAGSSAFASLAPQPASDQKTVSSCWLGITEDSSTLSYSRQIIYKAYHLGGYTTPDLATATNDERITGMFRLILIVITLYVLGAILTGMTFFAMAWTGQHVLRSLRVEVFEKLHSLSLSYYAEHEAGDLMSRITNDTSAIE